MSVLILASSAPNLKAAQIAYFTRPGLYKQTWLLDLDVDIVSSAISVIHFDDKKQAREKKRKGQRRSVRGSQGERNGDFTNNF